MHEYSVVTELISALLPRLEEHTGDVTAIFLKKGELRILSDRALKNAFELLAQETRLAGASLEIEIVSARVACRSCGYEGGVEYYKDEALHFAVPVLSCPRCKAEVEILSGRDLYVDRVSLCTSTGERPSPDR